MTGPIDKKKRADPLANVVPILINSSSAPTVRGGYKADTRRQPKRPASFRDPFNEGVWSWYFASGSLGERDRIYNTALHPVFDHLSSFMANDPKLVHAKQLDKQELKDDLLSWCFITLTKIVPNPNYDNQWSYFNRAIMNHRLGVVNGEMKYLNSHETYDSDDRRLQHAPDTLDCIGLKDEADQGDITPLVEVIDWMDPGLTEAVLSLDHTYFTEGGLKRRGMDRLVLELGNPKARRRKIRKALGTLKKSKQGDQTKNALATSEHVELASVSELPDAIGKRDKR